MVNVYPFREKIQTFGHRPRHIVLRVDRVDLMFVKVDLIAVFQEYRYFLVFRKPARRDLALLE